MKQIGFFCAISLIFIGAALVSDEQIVNKIIVFQGMGVIAIGGLLLTLVYLMVKREK